MEIQSEAGIGAAEGMGTDLTENFPLNLRG